MKILFMGTPSIAAESLSALILAGHNICGVFTREDKPIGRKQILTPPPVKQLALEHNISVFQPKSLKNEAAAQDILALSPDIIVVVAYGRILPKEILDIPKYGCINLHVSLLPKYRGAAPIQWAVINGERETGVSIMYMDEGLDTGDIIHVVSLEIGENETSGELFNRVSSIGATALCEALQQIHKEKAVRTKQDNSKATIAPLLQKDIAGLSFNKEAHVLHNLVRGLNPWPVAYFEHDSKKIKVLKTKKILCENKSIGEIISVNPLVVACLDGAIELCELVPEGARQMSGSAWAAGKRLLIGDFL